MRKRLLSFLTTSALLSQTFPAPGPNVPRALVVSSGIFTLVSVNSGSCSNGASACSINATVGAGHLLVLYSATNSAVSYLSATGDSFTHCPASGASNATGASADCAYVLSSAGGSNTYTFTWTSAPTALVVYLLEFSYSGSSVSYDAGNVVSNSLTASTLAAPSLALSGNNDVIIQMVAAPCNPSSIAGPAYINPPYTFNSVGTAIAGAINQTSYSAPTWTMNCTYFGFVTSAVAFAGN